jgi:sugar transferase (PEP-CTERM/EpsH1 system associated)
MDELLFLCHRIPYPPNKGDKLRSFHLLKQLRRRYCVHVGAFIDDPDDWRHTDAVRALAGECHFAPLAPGRARLRSLPALFGEEPLSLAYYRDRGMRTWVDGLLAERPVRQAVVFSGAMAQYVAGPPYAHLRRIVDFVDVDSDKWRQYARTRSWPMSWIYAREARTLLSYERRVAAEMDASVFVSAAEAALFRKCAPEAAARVWDVHNGVDTKYFDPARTYPSPYAEEERAVVFTGAMDYHANVDAVVWFAREVLPLLRRRQEAARFYIVGARPTETVRRLARLPGVTVTGAVDDIRPYLAHARTAVAPLRLARGVQNKVLEAMAMAKAVVATPEALDGIECRVGEEVIQAADAVHLAQRLAEVLENGAGELGAAARRRVEGHYSWEGNLSRFESLLADAPLPRSARKKEPADFPAAADLG